MSSLEREIIKKFHQLDRNAQQRVRALIDQQTYAEEQKDLSKFDYEAWFRDVDALRQEIRASHGDELPPIDVVGLLRDIRDDDDE